MPLPNIALLMASSITFIFIILFLLALQEALKRCSPTSRTMTPGKVWLQLIPLFGLLWQFLIVTNLALSLGNEFNRLGIRRPEPALGKNIGIAMCICNCFTVIPFFRGLLEPIGFQPWMLTVVRDLAGLVALPLWIAYWSRINRYSGLLEKQRTIAASPTT